MRAHCAVGFAVACALVGCRVSPAARNATKLYDQGDFAGAAEAADRGLATDRGDADLWRVRLRAELARGDRRALAELYAGYTSAAGGSDVDAALLRELAVATLGQGLTSNSSVVRIAAISAVERFEIEQLAKGVMAQLDHTDDSVVATAAIAVLRGHPQAPQIADAMLTSPDVRARAIVVAGIGRKVGAPATRELLAAARDSQPQVRAAAISAVVNLDDTETASAILAGVTDPSDEVRRASLTAAARRKLGDARELARTAGNDASFSVRVAAIELLRGADLREELGRLRNDKDIRLALLAASALRGEPQNEDLLRKATSHQLAAVRADAATHAEALVGRAQSLAWVAPMLKDPDPKVRLAAARASDYAGDNAGATATFLAALEASNPELRISAAGSLARMGHSKGSELLTRALVADLDPRTRSAAVFQHTVAQMITPGLVAALADPSGEIRVFAAAELLALVRKRP